MDIVDLSYTSVIIVTCAVIAASIISSVTGMAGGILTFSAMSAFIPVRPLIAIHGVVQVFNNSARAWYLRSSIRWSMCLPFALGAGAGAAVTTAILVHYAGELAPLIILAILIFYTLFKPKRIPHFKLKDRNFIWVGLAAGSLGMLAGAVDPLLGAFFLRDDMTKREVVANKSMMQLFTHLTKVPAFLYLGFNYLDNIVIITIFSLAAIFATRFGVTILNKITDEVFFKLMWWALLFAGLRIIYQIFLIVEN